jgi:hypothetical protein
MQDFGVIVICSKNDLLFAKGCCASIRYFLGDTPICLLVDGDFDLDGLHEVYNAIVIRRENIRDEFLRTKSFGWGTTRMIAFWESPFKHFLLIDADTCIWGDIRTHANFSEYDIIIDLPDNDYDEVVINEYFFDVKSFTQLFPDFDLMKHAYVCPAVLFGKRGALDLQRYKDIMQVVENNPGMFKYGDMGFFNYLLFTAKEEKKLRLGQLDIQYLVPDYPIEDAKTRFVLNSLGPNIKNRDKYHIAPMTFFRKQYLRDKGLSVKLIDLTLRKEDFMRELSMQTRYYQKRIPQIIKSSIS